MMTYKEFASKAEDIIQAIDNENYEIYLEAPNFVSELKLDGCLYLIVRDIDGPKSSNDCGSGKYTICGEEFYHKFSFENDEEPESNFFAKAKELEDYPNEIEEDVNNIIQNLKDKIRELAPSLDGVEEQAEAYAKAMGIYYDEAFWYEDPDCPCEYEEGEDEDSNENSE